MQRTKSSSLPRATDRLPLGREGLEVSPLCIGMVGDPAIVPAAFDAGVNFFFLSADLHWPLYDSLRRGLELLFSRGGSIRDEVVVGVVSYLEEPIFRYLQFHEVTDSVAGLERADVLIAGAVSNEKSLNDRYRSIHDAQRNGHMSSRAIGASFHDRRSALISLNYDFLDINFIRYNTAHPGANYDLFPYLRADHGGLIFNFKSLMSRVLPETLQQLGLDDENRWQPKPTDYYRFVFTNPHFDGILCSPASIAEIEQTIAVLEEGPLTAEEEAQLLWMSSVASPKVF